MQARGQLGFSRDPRIPSLRVSPGEWAQWGLFQGPREVTSGYGRGWYITQEAGPSRSLSRRGTVLWEERGSGNLSGRGDLAGDTAAPGPEVGG